MLKYKNSICGRCGRVVYYAEQKVALNKVWHSFCFSCVMCRKLLDSCTVTPYKNELYCGPCFRRANSFEIIEEKQVKEEVETPNEENGKGNLWHTIQKYEEVFKKNSRDVTDTMNTLNKWKRYEVINQLKNKRRNCLEIKQDMFQIKFTPDCNAMHGKLSIEIQQKCCKCPTEQICSKSKEELRKTEGDDTKERSITVVKYRNLFLNDGCNLRRVKNIVNNVIEDAKQTSKERRSLIESQQKSKGFTDENSENKNEVPVRDKLINSNGEENFTSDLEHLRRNLDNEDSLNKNNVEDINGRRHRFLSNEDFFKEKEIVDKLINSIARENSTPDLEHLRRNLGNEDPVNKNKVEDVNGRKQRFLSNEDFLKVNERNKLDDFNSQQRSSINSERKELTTNKAEVVKNSGDYARIKVEDFTHNNSQQRLSNDLERKELTLNDDKVFKINQDYAKNKVEEAVRSNSQQRLSNNLERKELTLNDDKVFKINQDYAKNKVEESVRSNSQQRLSNNLERKELTPNGDKVFKMNQDYAKNEVEKIQQRSSVDSDRRNLNIENNLNKKENYVENELEGTEDQLKSLLLQQNKTESELKDINQREVLGDTEAVQRSNQIEALKKQKEYFKQNDRRYSPVEDKFSVDNGEEPKQKTQNIEEFLKVNGDFVKQKETDNQHRSSIDNIQKQKSQINNNGTNKVASNSGINLNIRYSFTIDNQNEFFRTVYTNTPKSMHKRKKQVKQLHEKILKVENLESKPEKNILEIEKTEDKFLIEKNLEPKLEKKISKIENTKETIQVEATDEISSKLEGKYSKLTESTLMKNFDEKVLAKITYEEPPKLEKERKDFDEMKMNKFDEKLPKFPTTRSETIPEKSPIKSITNKQKPNESVPQSDKFKKEDGNKNMPSIEVNKEPVKTGNVFSKLRRDTIALHKHKMSMKLPQIKENEELQTYWMKRNYEINEKNKNLQKEDLYNILHNTSSEYQKPKISTLNKIKQFLQSPKTLHPELIILDKVVSSITKSKYPRQRIGNRQQRDIQQQLQQQKTNKNLFQKSNCCKSCECANKMLNKTTSYNGNAKKSPLKEVMDTSTSYGGLVKVGPSKEMLSKTTSYDQDKVQPPILSRKKSSSEKCTESELYCSCYSNCQNNGDILGISTCHNESKIVERECIPEACFIPTPLAVASFYNRKYMKQCNDRCSPELEIEVLMKRDNNKCRRCRRKVYIVEQIKAAGGVFHDCCFSCYICRRPLDTLRFISRRGEIYCKQCYTSCFGPQIYGYRST